MGSLIVGSLIANIVLITLYVRQTRWTKKTIDEANDDVFSLKLSISKLKGLRKQEVDRLEDTRDLLAKSLEDSLKREATFYTKYHQAKEELEHHFREKTFRDNDVEVYKGLYENLLEEVKSDETQMILTGTSTILKG